MWNDTLLGLKRPPAPAAIAAINGVARVEAAGEGLFRIGFAGGIDPTDELVRQAVEQSWGLYQLTPAQASLEDVFGSLTRKEEQA